MTESELLLAAYVPRSIAASAASTTWLVDGTVVFADVSGFTKLSERLAGLGKAGAEALTDILNATFTGLLGVAVGEGGDLLSYGGDALLLLFEGSDHATRACRAAHGMRTALKRQGPVQTDAGQVRLRVSQGVHSGSFRVVAAGTTQRALLLVGAEATTVTAMEAAADAGEVLVSPATAVQLPARWIGAAKADGWLLRASPSAVPVPADQGHGAVDPRSFLPPAVVARLSLGGDEPEHRYVSVGFVHVAGVDGLLAPAAGPAPAGAGAAAGVAALLTRAIDAAVAATAAHGTCLLSTDIAPDGVKLIITAGAPDAVEDGEGRLLATLRDVLDAGSALPVRAGAHAGHVFAGDVGSPDRRVYTVIGDAVNLAARMMGKARPGELVASAALVQRSVASFATVEMEPFRVKGKRHLQEAHLVGARLAHRARSVSLAAPFVSRSEERETLRSGFAAARGGRGRVIEIVGEAGVGKSRLIGELLREVGGTRVVRVTSEPYQVGRPYYAARLVLRAVLQIPQQADRQAAGDALAKRVTAIDDSWSAWLPLLAVPLDAEVPATPEVDALAPEYRTAMLHEISGQLLGAVLDEPTVLVFDDAAYMDSASAHLFARAFADAGRRPWLVLTTRRASEVGLHAGLGFEADTIELAPLGPSDLRALATSVTEETPIPDHEIDALVERAGGNPLFLLEMVSARLDAGSIDHLPTSLEDIVASRLDALPPSDRRVLRYASVLGDRFPPDLVIDTLEDLVPAVADPTVWDRLSDFVVIDQGDLRFAHGLVRQVAYEGLPFARRREVHRRVAEVLARRFAPGDSVRLSLLALHYDRAGEVVPAYRYCREAGHRARADAANVEAAAYFARAIENGRRAGVDDGELGELAEVMGDVGELAAQYAVAESAYRMARRWRSADAIAAARLLRKEGVVRERTSRYPAALGWYRRGLAAAARLDEPWASSERAELEVAVAGVKMRQGRLRECVRWAQRARADAVVAHNKRAEAHAYYLLDVAFTDLGRADVDEVRHRSLEIFEELGDAIGIARALGNLSVDARYEGRWDDALDLASRCAEVQRRSGDVAGLAMSLYNSAEVLEDQGQLGEAEQLLRDARRTWRSVGFPLGVAAATGALGRVALRAGRDDEAVALVDEAVSLFKAMGADGWVAEMEAHRVEADLFAGRWAAVLEAVPSNRVSATGGQDAALSAKLARFRGVALGATASPEAATVLEAALELARAAGADYEVALTLVELAREPTVAPSRREECEAQAARLLDRLGVVDVAAITPALVRA